MNMQWPTPACVSEYEATRSVFVRRIVFDDFALGDGVLNLSHADLSDDTLVHSVFRELEPSGLELLANGNKGIHSTVCRCLLRATDVGEAILLQGGSDAGQV